MIFATYFTKGPYKRTQQVNNVASCWVFFGQQCCVRLHGPKSLTGCKLHVYATSANKCQHCCGSMQNNVACCWPTMLHPLAWTLRDGHLILWKGGGYKNDLCAICFLGQSALYTFLLFPDILFIAFQIPFFKIYRLVRSSIYFTFFLSPPPPPQIKWSVTLCKAFL